MPRNRAKPAPECDHTPAVEGNGRKGRLPSGKAKSRAGYSPAGGFYGPWLPDSPFRAEAEAWATSPAEAEAPPPAATEIPAETSRHGEDRPAGQVARLSLTASEATPRPRQMLVDGLCFRQGMGCIAGASDQGKTTLMIDLLARLAGGLPLPNGRRYEPMKVALLTGEAHPRDEVIPALAEAGAILDNVLLPQLLPGDEIKQFNLTHRLGDLADHLQGFGAQVVGIDPMTSFLDKDFDINGTLPVRRFLMELNGLGREMDFATLYTMHLNKARGADAGARIVGSHEWMSYPRPVWMVGEDPQRPGHYVMACEKPGSMRRPPSLAYSLPGAGDNPKAKWEGESNLTADDVLADQGDPGERDAGRDAEVFLMLALADGDAKVCDLQRDSKAEGLAWATVRRAKKRLRITSHPIGRNEARFFVWRAPAEGFPRSIIPPTPADRPERLSSSVGAKRRRSKGGVGAPVDAQGGDSPKLYEGEGDKEKATPPGAA